MRNSFWQLCLLGAIFLAVGCGDDSGLPAAGGGGKGSGAAPGTGGKHSGGTTANASTASGAATSTTKGTASTGACPTGTPKTGGKQYSGTYSAGNVGNGYHYELWTNGVGSGTMTVFGDEATFKASWSSIGDIVARVGLRYDETQTAAQLGTFAADYAFAKSGLSGLAYMGIYGWMSSPLVEYYIVEDWNQWRPNYTAKGTVTIDGGEYDIMTNTQVDQPSIKGNTTFTQWWSVRKTGRHCGHISVSEHFAAWQKAGAQLGNLYEVKLKAEGLNGSGTVEYTKASVTLTK